MIKNMFDFIIKNLLNIAKVDATDYLMETETGEKRMKPLAQLPRAAQSVSVKRNRFGEQEVSFKLVDRMKALELLGKTIGLYQDVVKTEVTITEQEREAKKKKLEFMNNKLRASKNKGSETGNI
jgi:hypothetical protein